MFKLAKARELYVCRSCGYETPKWYGKCPGCGGWNTLEQVEIAPAVPSNKKVVAAANGEQAQLCPIKEVDVNDEIRFLTGVSELDRVLGGGIVKGSVVLLGGDPGIGKSTLLLQICQYLGRSLSILYVSGEESVRQIKLRADRLKVDSENLYLLADINVERIANTILAKKPDLVMVDSIQTMNIQKLQSSPGSVMQVRESTNAFLHLAKSEDIPVIIVGHVNKDGAIAGPKVLEHIVDAVLHFEGDRNQNFRILRAVKNRFGSTNEIGVFEMLDGGLQEVQNPSMMLLDGRPEGASGTCVACIMEGTRPILAEVQALVCKTAYGMPRRTATGFDYNRLALILAVLEKRCGYYFSSLDAYINVVGGLRLDEPAADLSIALALISSLRDKPISGAVLAFGEIGLAGEVRGVTNLISRVKEARRLGFDTCIVSKNALRELKSAGIDGIEMVGVSTVREAVKKVLDN